MYNLVLPLFLAAFSTFGVQAAEVLGNIVGRDGAYLSRFCRRETAVDPNFYRRRQL